MTSAEPAVLEISDEVLLKFMHRLLAIATRYISQELLRRYDQDDVVLSAFRTFFRHLRNGEYRLSNEHDLWKLLALITVRKARMKARENLAERRSVRSEVPLSESRHVPDDRQAEDGAVLIDLIENLLRDRPEQHGEILGQLLMGYSQADIAKHTKLSKSGVQRIVAQFQSDLKRILKEATTE